MNVDGLLGNYRSGRHDAVLDQLYLEWPRGRLPDDTEVSADACYLGVMSSLAKGDKAGEMLWRSRAVACAIDSRNFSLGALIMGQLAGTASDEGKFSLAGDIFELVRGLLSVAGHESDRGRRYEHPSLSEASRIFHEQRARFLFDAARQARPGVTIDEAIAVGRLALGFCKEDRRASLKVRGGIANMTYASGRVDEAVRQTSEIYSQARSENMEHFARIAQRNQERMARGDRELVPYQVET